MAQVFATRATATAPTASMDRSSMSAMRGTPVQRPANVFRAALAPRSPVARRAPLKINAVMDVTEDNFDAEVLQFTDRHVLVDFWATWCGPCKLVAPSMVWAEKTFPDALKVVKVNCTDGNKALMEKYKVYGLPCLIVFNGGEEVAGSHYEGAISKTKLGKYLEQHVGVSVPAA